VEGQDNREDCLGRACGEVMATVEEGGIDKEDRKESKVAKYKKAVLTKFKMLKDMTIYISNS
jgi:hypothetical protein